MELEEVKPNKPKFALIGYLVLATLLVILIGAAIIVSWRAREVHKTPFTKQPTSRLVQPPKPFLRNTHAA